MYQEENSPAAGEDGEVLKEWGDYLLSLLQRGVWEVRHLSFRLWGERREARRLRTIASSPNHILTDLYLEREFIKEFRKHSKVMWLGIHAAKKEHDDNFRVR